MNLRYNLLTVLLFTILISVGVFFFNGCDIYEYDGNENTNIAPESGYFYLLERSTVSLIMMDNKLREVERWSLYPVLNDSSLQGITYDGEYLWISSAGNADRIFQVDASSDSLLALKVIDAPPLRRGTVRDITWVSGSLWVINSGSTTYKTPATLYEVNPNNGTIITEVILPSPEPRGLTWCDGYTNIYNSGIEAGLYYSDVSNDKIYKYRYDRPFIDTLFSTPQPPRGAFTNFPAGLTFDGKSFWLINSSDVADHLYKITVRGTVEERFDLPYSEPGPIVFIKADIRIGTPPTIAAILPVNGAAGSTLDVDIYGTGFKPGASVSFGNDITANSTTFISQTLLKSNITISASALQGKRDITVTNPGGISAKLDTAFNVTTVTTTPYLWLADQASGQRYLYKIRITDTTVVQEWETGDVTSDGVQGVAYDGNNFWLSASGSSRSLFKINVTSTSLQTILTIPLSGISGGTLRGIVYENGYIWQAVSTIGKIYKINPSNGAIEDSISTPGIEPRGICFANDVLYCNDTSIDSVFAYNSVTQSWAGVFATPTPPGGTTSNRFATGLAFDGQSFWIANSTGDFDHVFNLSINGAVLRYFSAPRLGAAQLTGIVVIEE